MKASWKFIVEAMPIMGGRQIRAMKPDDQGYYDVPLMAIGVPARSGIVYTPEPLLNCIQSPASRFNIMLKDSSLFGCIDHPEVFTKEDIPKLLEIKQTDVSHHIKSIYTGAEIENGGVLLMGKVKPWGPYGHLLEQSFQDPNINTAFSVRSLCKERMDMSTRQVFRDIQILVTFDWVHAPGFKESCKRYAPSTESYSIAVNPADFIKDYTGSSLACESITDAELMNVFGLSQVQLGNMKGSYIKGNKTFIGEDGNKHSVLHALLGKR